MVYGGTLTDPDGDPRCRTRVSQGIGVPRSVPPKPPLSLIPTTEVR